MRPAWLGPYPARLPGGPANPLGVRAPMPPKLSKGCKARRPANRASQQVLFGGEPQDGKAARVAVPPNVLTLADEVIE
jgi:hypothetical protein